MRSRNSDCEECEGSKHVWDEERKRWVKCVCARAQQTQDAYQRAGVGERFDGESWQTMFATYRLKRGKDLLRAMVGLKQGEVPSQWFMITGRPSRARDLIATLVLRTAVDGGRRAISVDLAELIQAEFGRAEEDRRDGVTTAEVVVLYAGGEPKHSYNRHAIERVIRRAYGKKQALVLIAEANPGDLKKFYKSGIVQEALSTAFLRVEVEPKEEESE